MQARAPSATDGETPEEAFTRHLREVRSNLQPGMTAVARPPFVVIGNERRAQVVERTKGLVEFAVHQLTRDFFPRQPDIVHIWMFRDAQSYRRHTRELTGHLPSTPYGFYRAQDRAIYMNISTGVGTLIHEMVHPYMEANFPDCPPWYDEGLGSLFEGSDVRNGHMVGTLNWRLEGLQQSIDDDSLQPLAQLLVARASEFYGDPTGNNYAAARYLLYYLQEHRLLHDFHHAFVAAHAHDPSGRATLERILQQELATFEPQWRQWVLELRPFRKRIQLHDDEGTAVSSREAHDR